MSTVYGAYMSPLKKEITMLALESESEYTKICAMERLQEATLQAEYARIEAQVLQESGTTDDLFYLYQEASANAQQTSESIFKRLLNWIQKKLSDFGAWIQKACGKNNERLNGLNNRQVTYKKSDKNIIDAVKKSWGQVNAFLDNAHEQLDKRLPSAVQLAIPTLETIGLAILGGKLFQQNKEQNNVDVTDEGSNVDDVVNDVNNIVSQCQNHLKKFQALEKTFESIKAKWKDANDAAIEQRRVAKENKAKKKATNPAQNNGQGEPETPTDTNESMSGLSYDEMDIVMEAAAALQIFDDVFMEANKRQKKKNEKNKNAQNAAANQVKSPSNPQTPPANNSGGSSAQAQSNSNGSNGQPTKTGSNGGTNNNTAGNNNANTSQNQNPPKTQTPPANNSGGPATQNQSTGNGSNGQPAKTGSNGGTNNNTGGNNTNTGQNQNPSGNQNTENPSEEGKPAENPENQKAIDEFNFADKCIIKINAIIKFITSIISAFSDCAVGFLSRVLPWVNNKDENNNNPPEGTPDGTENTGDQGTGTGATQGGTPGEGQQQTGNTGGTQEQQATESVNDMSVELFGFELESCDLVTQDVYNQISEILDTL